MIIKSFLNILKVVTIGFEPMIASNAPDNKDYSSGVFDRSTKLPL